MGRLFWVVGRTSDRSKANLAIDDCSVTSPHGLGVMIPGPLGGAHTVKMSKGMIPKILMLLNKARVPGTTLLVGHEDPVVARAREEDKALPMAKRAKQE